MKKVFPVSDPTRRAEDRDLVARYPRPTPLSTRKRTTRQKTPPGRRKPGEGPLPDRSPGGGPSPRGCCWWGWARLVGAAPQERATWAGGSFPRGITVSAELLGGRVAAPCAGGRSSLSHPRGCVLAWGHGHAGVSGKPGCLSWVGWAGRVAASCGAGRAVCAPGGTSPLGITASAKLLGGGVAAPWARRGARETLAAGLTIPARIRPPGGHGLGRGLVRRLALRPLRDPGLHGLAGGLCGGRTRTVSWRARPRWEPRPLAVPLGDLGAPLPRVAAARNPMTRRAASPRARGVIAL